jgi:lipoprotein-releasing system permease protein
MFRPLALFVGLRYLRARRRNQFVSFISLMSLLGVIVGVAALIVVLSVMNGFENELRQRLLAMTSHATITGPDQRLADWEAVAAQVVAVPGVRAAAPFVEIQGMLGNGSRLKAAVVRGIVPDLEPAVSEVGEHLIFGDLEALRPGSNEVVLGRLLAAQLGVGPGDRLTLMVPSGAGGRLVPRLHRLTVAGIFEVGMQEHDGVLALMHIDDAAGILDLGEDVSGVRLSLAEMLDAPAVSKAVSASLGPGYTARDWTQENASYFRAVGIEKTMMTIVLLLVVGVAAFNIVATLVMVVTDKRSEIAILRTIGVPPGGVTRIFLVQGLVIGIVGTLVGAAVGVPLALNVETIAPRIESLLGVDILPADVYYIASLPSEVRVPDVVRVTLLAFGLCALATLYPSWRAARTQPAEALRYDH